MSTPTPENRPADWKNYEDFAAGIATNRLPPTDALNGQNLEFTLPDGPLSLSFGSKLVWQDSRGSGSDGYEVIAVAPDTYFIRLSYAERPREALILIANLTTRRVLGIRSVVRPEPVPGEPQVHQDFLVGYLGHDPAAASGLEPGPTRELIGLRAHYTYSPNHTYEHTYLSSTRYAWQCLRGVQRGHGDVDLATTYKFADNQYIFAFREFKIAVASTFFYNFDTMRSTGCFLGITGAGTVELNPAGAFIQKASITFYPKDLEPV